MLPLQLTAHPKDSDMAVIRAVASGNWSATGTWQGGVLPGNGDTVTANGFTVTINQNVTIGGENNPSVNAGSFVVGQWYRITFVGTTTFTSIGASANSIGIVFQATGVGSGTGTATALATLTTAPTAGSAAGGGFTFASSGSLNTINADIRAGSTTCLTITGTSNVSLGSQNIVAGSVANSIGVSFNNTAGTLSISSSSISSANNSGTHAILNFSTAIISASSCILSGGGQGNAFAFFNFSTGSIFLNTCTMGGTTAGGCVVNNAAGTIAISNSTINSIPTNSTIQNNGAGTITISSCPITHLGGISTNSTITTGTAGTITITDSTLTASSTAQALVSTNNNAVISVSGILIGSPAGFPAVNAARWRVGTSPTGSYISQSLNGTSTMFTWYAADWSGFGQPSILDVRNGVSYASGSLTGTCTVPPAGSVALGVPVDNTTGTAVLTASAIQSALDSYGASKLTSTDITNAVIPLV